MNVILLAAGMGKRLGEANNNLPKSLLNVKGKTLLDNLLWEFSSQVIKNVVIVTGFQEKALREYAEQKWSNIYKLVFINNPIYDTTNNIYSLWLAREYMNEPYFIVESDVFFNPGFIDFGNLKQSYWFAEPFTEKFDGCRLTCDENKKISEIEIIREKQAEYLSNQFKSTGIVYIYEQNEEIIKLLNKEIKAKNTNIYYDLLFAKYISKINLFVRDVSPRKWIEIDNEEDLRLAEEMF